VRLCKGAYAEPADVAFPNKADTDANFVKLTQMMLSDEARANGVYLGVAHPRREDDSGHNRLCECPSDPTHGV
jgi:proline dehydrogenase